MAGSPGIDVVWLKKDVRLHDHAPIAAAAVSGRRFALLYIYEPGQVNPTLLSVTETLQPPAVTQAVTKLTNFQREHLATCAACASERAPYTGMSAARAYSLHWWHQVGPVPLRASPFCMRTVVSSP